MEFERKRYRHPYLNMTPLVDVVFLLLLFFMLTSHLIQEPSIGLSLPPSDTAVVDDAEGLTLSITRTGALFLDEKTVSPADLGKALARLDPSRDKHLRIRADRAVDVGLLVEIVDRVRQAGITQFSLVTAAPSATED